MNPGGVGGGQARQLRFAWEAVQLIEAACGRAPSVQKEPFVDSSAIFSAPFCGMLYVKKIVPLLVFPRLPFF